MWLEATVIIDTPAAGNLELRLLHAAMERRGWTRNGVSGFCANFTDVSSEERVVKLIEQDVCDSVTLSGISEYDAVCLLSESRLSKELDHQFDNQDSDISLGQI